MIHTSLPPNPKKVFVGLHADDDDDLSTKEMRFCGIVCFHMFHDVCFCHGFSYMAIGQKEKTQRIFGFFGYPCLNHSHMFHGLMMFVGAFHAFSCVSMICWGPTLSFLFSFPLYWILV